MECHAETSESVVKNLLYGWDHIRDEQRCILLNNER